MSCLDIVDLRLVPSETGMWRGGDHYSLLTFAQRTDGTWIDVTANATYSSSSTVIQIADPLDIVPITPTQEDEKVRLGSMYCNLSDSINVTVEGNMKLWRICDRMDREQWIYNHHVANLEPGQHTYA